MIIRTINSTNINKLRKAFSDYLLDLSIRFDTIALLPDGDKLILIFENNEKEKGYAFEFESIVCIGQEIQTIVREVIDPMLPRLKEVE